jgi:hypothetical protein
MRAPTPAAATTADGMHLFVRTPAGSVAERTLRGSTWSGWTSLGGTVDGGPAAVAIGPTTTAVVAIGTNNAVYRQTVTDTGATSGWTSLGGTVTSRASVTVAPNGVESVVVRGTNGQAYLRQRVGAQWGAWQSLGGLLNPVAPAAAVTASGVLTIAAVGTDGAMYVKSRSAAGIWSGWRRVGGGINADVALSTTADGTRLVAVVRGTGSQNGYVSVGNADATSWTGWTNIAGTLASGPAVTVNGSALDLFVVGTNNLLYRKSATDGVLVTGWTTWQPLP